MKAFLGPLLGALALSVSGCASHYLTPGGGVSLVDIVDEDLLSFYEREPASMFPANLALVRVQDSGYVSKTVHGYGHGRYTIVTTRDIESDEAYETIASLPLVQGVAPIGRILLPANASTIKDLRTPAAKIRSDLLLVYSVDTAFSVEGKPLGPLTAISLGFIPNKKAQVTATVAGILVDVRTTEATARDHQRATVWSTENAIEASRLRAEQQAFDSFITEFAALWNNVVNIHATNGSDRPRISAR